MNSLNNNKLSRIPYLIIEIIKNYKIYLFFLDVPNYLFY